MDNEKMQLQGLINILSNMLASGAGEAYIKFEDKNIGQVDLVEIDGVQTVTFKGVDGADTE